MAVFSRRYGYRSPEIEYEFVSKELLGRIWGIFFKEEFDYYDTFQWEHYTTGIEDMMVEMGVSYVFPDNHIHKNRNAEALKKYLSSSPWYVLFDFIERYLSKKKAGKADELRSAFNKVLEDEVSGYRIVGKLVVPITGEAELATIRTAMETSYIPVNRHIEKALELFADRKKPDYENSVKESISAVEAICCIITGMSGSQATLGIAIKKLKDSGVHIHGAMERAFLALYGYTSDENGIRHGGIDFTSVPAEDAKYMLVSCSAFVNYLIEKWSKVNP